MNNTQVKAFEAIVADPEFWSVFVEFNRQLAVDNEPLVTAGELMGAMAHLVIDAEMGRHPMLSTARH